MIKLEDGTIIHYSAKKGYEDAKSEGKEELFMKKFKTCHSGSSELDALSAAIDAGVDEIHCW